MATCGSYGKDFRNGKSDLLRADMMAQLVGAEKVSTSPANDWEPAIATDSSGKVYVAGTPTTKAIRV